MQTMTREEAHDYIKNNTTTVLDRLLQRDKTKKGYVCPICGSGSGKNGTGITTKDGVHYQCWAGGCIEQDDVFAIIGKINNTTDYNEQLRLACDLLGIEITLNGGRTNRKTAQKTAAQEPPKAEEPPPTDYTDYFRTMAKNIEKTDYHRGIRLATLKKLCIGFDPDYKGTGAPRLIIPLSQYSFEARYCGDCNDGYRHRKEGKRQPFYIHKADFRRPIIITEAEIDAISVIDCGGNAIGMNGVNGINELIDKLKERLQEDIPDYPLILSLDNDDAGRAATEKLTAQLKEIALPYIVYLVSGEKCKDANELLNADRNALTANIKAAEKAAEQYAEQEAQQAAEAYINAKSAYGNMDGFRTYIEKSRAVKPQPTGYTALDTELGGGLYAGLYVVMALPSLGKTTFCVSNIADQIAEQGRDVLIFSLEMARYELMAKSISRQTFLYSQAIGQGVRYAKSTRDILSKGDYEQTTYFDNTPAPVTAAMKNYATYAPHLFIYEGIGTIGTAEIRQEIQEYIKATRRTKRQPPVVIIDYLQIIAPAAERLTDKQAADKSVLELKRLSRDFDIPVIAISSINRSSYEAGASMAAAKESGNIDFGCDVMIMLQYEGMGDVEKNANAKNDPNAKARKELKRTQEKNGREGKPQNIEAVILKNRNGRKGASVLFDFYPVYNTYKEKGVKEDTDIGL